MVVPVLSDGVVTLTEYTDDDIPDHLAGENEETARRFGWWPQTSTEDDARDAFQRWANSWRTDGAVRTFAARDALTTRLLGGCELRLQPDGSAHVSYWTSASERQRGHATRSLTLLLQYGESIGVTHFEAHVAPDNQASRRVSEKAGFRCSGTFTDDGGLLMIKYEQHSRNLDSLKDQIG